MHDDANLTGKTIAYYLGHAWRYKVRSILLAVSVTSSVLVFQFLPPLFLARILQRISNHDFVQGDLWGSFGTDLMIYAGLSLFGGVILWRLTVWLIWTLEIKVLQDINAEVFDHIMSMDIAFHTNRFGGSLVSQVNKLATSYILFSNTTVFQLINMLLSFVFAGIILFPRAPGIAFFLFGGSFILIGGAILLTRWVRRLHVIRARAENKQTGYLADAITNVFAVKSFAGSNQERKRYHKATQASADADYAVLVRQTERDLIFATLSGGLRIVAIIIAVAGVVMHDANIATTFLVITYTGVIGQNLWEFCQTTLRSYNRIMGDAREMISILGIQPAVKDPEQPEKCRIAQGAIKFDDVDFTHPESLDDQTLFHKLSLSIRPGEKIGLVGHSGSGKTTLTKLLLRYTDIDSGSISIDGQDITHIAQDDLRSNIAYVPQEPLLFHRSIRENIAYGHPGASMEEIRDAARKAYADEFIEMLPKKYYTLVGERGIKLSGGQRQRIAIARAIIKDAPILVLDEATSALDSESEKVIQAALWELMQGRTAIVVAHRLSTVQKLDRIIVLDHGKIIEEGSHQALLAEKGTYAKLWAHQSGGFIEE